MEPSGVLVTDLDGSLYKYDRTIWTGDFTKEISEDILARLTFLPWVQRRVETIRAMRPLYVNTGRGYALEEATRNCLARDGLGHAIIHVISANSLDDYIAQKKAAMDKQIAKAYIDAAGMRNIWVIEDSEPILDYLVDKYSDWPRLIIIAVKNGDPEVVVNNYEVPI